MCKWIEKSSHWVEPYPPDHDGHLLYLLFCPNSGTSSYLKIVKILLSREPIQYLKDSWLVWFVFYRKHRDLSSVWHWNRLIACERRYSSNISTSINFLGVPSSNRFETTHSYPSHWMRGSSMLLLGLEMPSQMSSN